MAANKTTETTVNVNDFINLITDEAKRKDAFSLVGIFEKQTNFQAKMWGPSIIGFGSYHYKYESGREGDSPIVAFSPRASAIVLYLSLNAEKREVLLPKFGKYKSEKGCIYIKKLADIDVEVLQEMIDASVANKL